MRKILVIIFIGLTFLSFDLPKSTLKKIDKTIASLWPEQIVSKNAINIGAEKKAKLSFKLDDNLLYKITNNNKPEAYLFLSKAKSKISHFDYMIIYNMDLTIKNVKMLIYREEYGGEIGSKRWLKQFIGKSNPAKMKFGHDIQNISGATISARSMTNDVKKVTKQIKELKEKGLI